MENDSELNGKNWVEERLSGIHPPTDWQPNASRALARLRERRELDQKRGRRWTWIAATVALTSVSLAAFPVTRAFAQRCVSVCISESGNFGQFVLASLSSRSPSPLDAQAGRNLAADFSLEDANGKPVKLSQFRGSVVLLNFWATWCVPCQAEIPWFVEFQRTNRDLVVLGVSLDEDGWTAVRPYMAEKRINYHVMLGSDDVIIQYDGVSSLPMTLIIDKSGRVAATHVGLCSKSDYEAEIKALLAER